MLDECRAVECYSGHIVHVPMPDARRLYIMMPVHTLASNPWDLEIK